MYFEDLFPALILEFIPNEHDNPLLMFAEWQDILLVVGGVCDLMEQLGGSLPILLRYCFGELLVELVWLEFVLAELRREYRKFAASFSLSMLTI